MSKLRFRLSRYIDLRQLATLWNEVFGDEEKLIFEFFRLLWRPAYCCVAEEGDHIVSMGYCIPGPEVRGLRCSYIYAMATAEPFRGRCAAQQIGLNLIQMAFDGGADIVATLPADEGLCRWYETRLGMAPLFRKGGSDVVFPMNWPEFAEVCGPHSPDTPDRLWAIPRPGLDPSPLAGLGWEYTFD